MLSAASFLEMDAAFAPECQHVEDLCEPERTMHDRAKRAGRNRGGNFRDFTILHAWTSLPPLGCGLFNNNNTCFLNGRTFLISLRWG